MSEELATLTYLSANCFVVPTPQLKAGVLNFTTIAAIKAAVGTGAPRVFYNVFES